MHKDPELATREEDASTTDSGWVEYGNASKATKGFSDGWVYDGGAGYFG